jgi:hypothetical protein
MPEISRFLGIVVQMYFEDHQPARFHARYGEYRVKVQIESGVVDDRFPPRALRPLPGTPGPLTWANGADFAPEFLHERLSAVRGRSRGGGQ